jgi:hypothetical protein
MLFVDLIALLVGAEGAKTRSKMQRAHFLLRCFFWGDYPTSYGRKGQWETPQALAPRRKKSEATAQLRQALEDQKQKSFFDFS